MQNQVPISRTPPSEEVLEIQEIQNSNFSKPLPKSEPNVQVGDSSQNEPTDSSITILNRPKQGGTIGKANIIFQIQIYF